MRTTCVMALFGAFVFSFPALSNPSFDCRKASQRDEIAICSDATLAKNDRLTTEAFNQAKRINRTNALATARAFLKKRKACGSDADCIADAQTQAVLDFAMLGARLPTATRQPPTNSAPNTDQDIRINCLAEWPGDYRMQEYCIRQQTEALFAVGPIAKSGSTIEREIVGKCASEWKKPIGYDYRMIHYCYEQQIGAYRRLNSN